VNSEVAVVDGGAGLPPSDLANAAALADVEGAVDVREMKPATLVVPDGTWRQARRIRRKLALPCVTLPPGAPTEYALRSDAHEGGLATLEAIARALVLLDGIDAEPMLIPFRAMVEHTLARRGRVG
jgi:DTW domain-containing protein YfiP